MQIPFRQGIVRYQLPDVVRVNGSFVDLVISGDQVFITFASGTKDYLFAEHASITNAWGPITPGQDTWLYWDIDFRTGLRTFGTTTLLPILGSMTPTNPAVGQHWFDSNTNMMKVWLGTAWVQKLRVFACKLQSGSSPSSMSINAPLFTGTQAGLNTSVSAGYIIFDSLNRPLKIDPFTFASTEDQLHVAVGTTADIKLAAIYAEATAFEQIPKYTIVKYRDFGVIEHANAFTTMVRGQFGIITVDANQGDIVNVITSGVVTNLSWDWTAVGVNQYLYVDNTGALVGQEVIPQQGPVALVMDKHTIMLDRVRTITTVTGTLIPGPAGPPGTPGTPGINGTNGVGVATGGTAGQVLAKIDATNFNTQWVTRNLVQVIPIAASDETTAITAGVAKVTFRMPYPFTLTSVKASLTTAQATGTIFTVNVKESGVSIFSTKLTIDNTQKTSATATVPAVISDFVLAGDAEITIDVDQIGDSTAKGLKVYLIGTAV